jgi:hypothetical protein
VGLALASVAHDHGVVQRNIAWCLAAAMVSILACGAGRSQPSVSCADGRPPRDGACAAEAGPARGDAAPTSALAAHWTFDTTGEAARIADATGHGNTGLVKGTAILGPGRIGGALRLDGSQYVAVEDSASQHSARAITVAGWLLLEEKDLGYPWRGLIEKANPKDGNWWGCRKEGEPDPNPCDEREYGAQVDVAGRLLGVYATTKDRHGNGGAVYCASPAGTIQYGEWHHFAGVVSPEARAIRVFIDATLVATCPLSEAGLHQTSQPLRIGASWVGMLDDLRIYAGELSEGEIATLAAAGST